MDVKPTRIAIGCLLCMLMSQAHSQTVYVKDSLRVGVRSEPGNLIAPTGVVVTGMQLEVLERKDEYVKIRTEKGLEGWISNSYVGEEVPAIIRLNKLQKEYDQLRSQTGKYDDVLKTSETTNKSLSQQISTLNAANTQLRLALDEQRQRSTESASSYIWLILLYVCVAAIGVVSGIAWHRRQAMKRLGGLRV